MSSRTPHRRVAERVGDLDRRADRVVVEVHEDRHGHLLRVAVGELPRGEHGVAVVGGDEPVRDGPHPAPAPPGRLGVGRHADRPGDVRGPAVAGLHEPVVVAGGEVEDLLAARRLDDLVDVAHDERAAGERPEVDGLEVGEQRVVALDRHDRLAGRDRLALVQRVDLEPVPAALPAAVRHPPPRALADDGDRLVDPAEQGVLALEHLHEDVRVVAVGLQEVARQREVRVGVVALADPLDREPEDLRAQPGALGARQEVLRSARTISSSAARPTSSWSSVGSRVPSTR